MREQSERRGGLCSPTRLRCCIAALGLVAFGGCASLTDDPALKAAKEVVEQQLAAIESETKRMQTEIEMEVEPEVSALEASLDRIGDELENTLDESEEAYAARVDAWRDALAAKQEIFSDQLDTGYQDADAALEATYALRLAQLENRLKYLQTEQPRDYVEGKKSLLEEPAIKDILRNFDQSAETELKQFSALTNALSKDVDTALADAREFIEDSSEDALQQYLKDSKAKLKELKSPLEDAAQRLNSIDGTLNQFGTQWDARRTELMAALAQAGADAAEKIEDLGANSLAGSSLPIPDLTASLNAYTEKAEGKAERMFSKVDDALGDLRSEWTQLKTRLDGLEDGYVDRMEAPFDDVLTDLTERAERFVDRELGDLPERMAQQAAKLEAAFAKSRETMIDTITRFRFETTD